ncbi:hypothetical protein D1013_09525 [Euzebyella marina]|uniref:Uncharacterized protein n=1 Tax=Euzebyella marina TaxID=1761453 RepID=A0A3G2L5N2_9FLAO|nr:hypothetical protein [Euzebyella marina]AYN67587.1 hypothetical protein D1013_09525 [Euzebyella marina]
MKDSEQVRLELYMNKVLEKKFNDIVVHTDHYGDEIMIACLWNRQSAIFYDNAKSFIFHKDKFDDVFENEIKPFFGV